jgi:IstB-like ATP binding protein
MPKTLATATVDRLLHHAHIVLTKGTSLRLAEATAGKGVTPPDLDQQEISCPRTGK